MAEYYVVYYTKVEAWDESDAWQQVRNDLYYDMTLEIDDEKPAYVGTKPPTVRIELFGGEVTVEEKPEFVDVTVIDRDDALREIVRGFVDQAVTSIRNRSQSVNEAAFELHAWLDDEFALDGNPLTYLLVTLAVSGEFPEGIAVEAFIDEIANELIDIYIA